MEPASPILLLNIAHFAQFNWSPMRSENSKQRPQAE
jgi:hypothetical protein